MKYVQVDEDWTHIYVPGEGEISRDRVTIEGKFVKWRDWKYQANIHGSRTRRLSDIVFFDRTTPVEQVYFVKLD